MTISSIRLKSHQAYLVAKSFGIECVHCDYHLEAITTSSKIDVVVIHGRGCRRGETKKAGFFTKSNWGRVIKKAAMKLKLV